MLPVIARNAYAPRVLTCARRSLGRRQPNQGKPPILPPSKKMLYRVVHPEWQKPEDIEELLWRRIVYNSAVISLREVFRQELREKEAAGTGVEHMREEEEKELDELLAANERRNEERREARRIREEKQLKETRDEFLREIEVSLDEKRAQAEASAKKVREAISRSSSFVTRENMEESILKALESPVVYDFAIDRSGKKYVEAAPIKYQEGTPTRQKGRLYEKTLGPFTTDDSLQEEPREAAAGNK